MKTPWMIPVAALAIGAAGGFIAGNNSSETADPATVEESGQRTRTSSRPGTVESPDSARRAARARSLEEIQALPGQSNRIQALMDYYGGLTPEQLEAEAKKLETLPMSERMLASILLFGRWAEEDPMAAMAYSNTLGMAGGFVRPNILQSWASVDPENAARYYSENSSQFGGGGGPFGQGGASAIAGEWARQDPESALAWANTLEGREKNQALSAVVRELASTDPSGAATMAAGMDADARGDAYEAIARQWGTSNFSEAESWIRSLPADQQDSAMASAIAGLSLQNPQLASQKVTAMNQGDERDRAMATLAGNWSRQEPTAALDWVMREGTPEAQSRSMREIIPTLASQDDSAALSFVTSQPAGEVRDSAASAYVMSNRNENPVAVMQVAESIDDNGSRMRTVAMAARRWMEEDPTAAANHIQQSESIPDRMKERLIEGPGEGQGNWGGGGGGMRRRGGR